MARRSLASALVVSALAAAALAAPGSAGAAAINGLAPVTGRDVGVVTIKGAPVFAVNGEKHGFELAAQVLDDAGQPVTGCLTAPAALHILAPSGKDVGTTTCASSSDGLFHVFTSGIVRPGAYTAVVDTATSLDGQAVTTVSAAVPVYVIPRMEKIQHFLVRGTTYPVEGRLFIPDAKTSGAFVLERKRKGVWKRISSQKPTRTGKWLFHVAVTSTTVTYWRVRFVPLPRTMWLAPSPVTYGLYRS